MSASIATPRTKRVEFSRHPAGGYRISGQQYFDRPVEEIFGFYSDAFMLERITIPSIIFRIVTAGPIGMKKGVLIDYQLRWRRIWMRWRTEICHWDPPFAFTDQQLKGPFRRWHHQHRFEPVAGGTLVTDDVHYRVPATWLLHRSFIRPDLKAIFDYRFDQLDILFPAGKPSPD